MTPLLELFTLPKKHQLFSTVIVEVIYKAVKTTSYLASYILLKKSIIAN